jgi:acyl carrier protein
MSVNPNPSTPMEERISGYWRELLGVQVVKPSDHFFELGGNSMMATLLANRIEDELGVRPSMEELFNTLEQVAIACEKMVEEGG